MTSASAFIQEHANVMTNTKLLGEVISWDLPENTKIKYQDLVQALNVAGLSSKVARELLPRYAFSRAAKKMADNRIIKRVAETVNDKIIFQFTQEYLDQAAERYRYKYETTLVLDKVTGVITSDDPSAAPLVQKATELLAQATEERTTADVSRVIKRLFELQADLFPVRSAGGVYFVPEKYETFVGSIDTFVRQLNGSLTRFPVPAGTERGNKSVKAAVESGIKEMLAAHQEAIEQVGKDTRPSTVSKAIARMEETQFKIEAYASYLEDAPARLKNELANLRLMAKQKLTEILEAKPQAEGV